MRSERIYYSFCLIQSLAFGFVAALYVPYLLEDVGLGYGQVSLVNLVFWVIILLAEVPTGMLADGKGRGYSIILGSIFGVIASSLYLFAQGIWLVLIAEFLQGIRYAFYSGALDAWVVDAPDRRASLNKIYGNREVARAGGMLVGMFGGSLLSGAFGLRFIYIGFTAAFALLLVLAWGAMRGGKEEKRLSEQEALAASWRQLQRDAEMRWIVIVKVLFGAVAVFNMYWTPVALTNLDAEQLPILFAPLYGGMLLAGWVVTRFSRRQESEARNVLLSILMTFLPLAAIWIDQPLAWMVLAFVLHEFGRGAYPALSSIFIDHRVESGYRATLQSLASFAGSLGMGAVLLLLWVIFSILPDTPEMIIWVWRITAIVTSIGALLLYVKRPRTS